ncbi:MAG: sodium transporter, partial [Calditrichales bacterium]
MNTIALTDILIIALYFVIVLGTGFYFSQKRDESSSEYFLAGRNVGWIAIGFSIFAANISSEHFIGLAGYGASRGLAVGSFEWLAIIFILILGWFLAPIFIKSKVFTIPEFFGNRFNSSVRIYLSAISIVAYLVTKVSVTLFAGGLLLDRIFGLDIYLSAIIMVVITGMYTIVGGMGAVIYTSVVQAVFLLVGATALTFIGLNEIGGIAGLHAKLSASYFDFFNGMSDPDIPWTGIIFGGPILAIWYWWADQYIMQRVLCAKNIEA